MTPDIHRWIEPIAGWLEVAGVLVILIGVLFASGRFALSVAQRRPGTDAYGLYRADLGRGLLLGLELLVGADIIATVTAPLTFESVGLLALIVLIRTFLSFALETEIQGCWPWQRATATKDQSNA